MGRGSIVCGFNNLPQRDRLLHWLVDTVLIINGRSDELSVESSLTFDVRTRPHQGGALREDAVIQDAGCAQ